VGAWVLSQGLKILLNPIEYRYKTVKILSKTSNPPQVAVLRGLALQLSRFHAAAGRNGKLPPEVRAPSQRLRVLATVLLSCECCGLGAARADARAKGHCRLVSRRMIPVDGSSPTRSSKDDARRWLKRQPATAPKRPRRPRRTAPRAKEAPLQTPRGRRVKGGAARTLKISRFLSPRALVPTRRRASGARVYGGAGERPNGPATTRASVRLAARDPSGPASATKESLRETRRA
jgi:hypothetical protein